jgi:hypothetical protein
MACTTWAPTPAGCRSATTVTPPRSRSRPFAAGGPPSAPPPTHTPPKLLITADAGGSNGYRLRLWKKELVALTDEIGIPITICHMPGSFKWNRIEHRLFSHISMNWAGQPLTSHEVAVNLIAATTTRTGPNVHAERDTGTYPRGIKIPDREMQALVTQYLIPCPTGTWTGTTPSARPTHPADRLVQLQGPRTIGDVEITLRTSIGITLTDSADTPAAALARADQAMYDEAKRGSGWGWCMNASTVAPSPAPPAT